MMEIGERNMPSRVSSRAHVVFFVAMMSAMIYDLRIVSALSEGSTLEKLRHDEGHGGWAMRRFQLWDRTCRELGVGTRRRWGSSGDR
jgi:hypothetical protein